MSSLKTKNENNAVTALSPGSITTNRISARWSNDEYQLAIRGIRNYGKDFQSIAEIIGTKNESQVNLFYTNYRKKYNLDEIIKEFEAKQLKEKQQKQKLNDALQKVSNVHLANIVSNADIKTDVKKLISDDEIMEVSNRGNVNVIKTKFCRVLRIECISRYKTG